MIIRWMISITVSALGILVTDSSVLEGVTILTLSIQCTCIIKGGGVGSFNEVESISRYIIDPHEIQVQVIY